MTDVWSIIEQVLAGFGALFLTLLAIGIPRERRRKRKGQ